MGVMTSIAVGLAVGSAVHSAVGQIRAGNDARRVGEFNAQVAEAQAKDAVFRGAEEESRLRTSIRGLIGSQRAGFAGQGVDVGGGSAADVQADAAFLGEQDAQQIRRNAAREAWGFRVEAENARRGGKIAQNQSRWGAAGTLLGTGSNLMMARYGFDGKGR
jgi:hypothetical protein